ncbi:MAG: bile acid:sodium symporter [Candidimonas sp.]
MSREKLERHQVWLYLIAILIGLATGGAAPGLAAAFEPLLWPGLALLLYATFTQAGLVELPASFKDGAFLSAALLGNFIVLPILVSGVLALVPDEPAIRLGLLLVLLVPCTDWFITFTHLAGGDLRRAIMITPVLLVAQMLLLPLYLWLFMGKEFMALVSTGRMAIVFAGVLILPLWLAWLTERWAKRHAGRAELVARIGRLPVPLLALVLFFIAASQVEAVRNSMPVMGDILMACAAFLAGATVCGLVIGRAFRLPTPQARTLVFTLTTRNSFVVLPLALALPATLGTASVVIVFQSLIELFGMLALLWLVPRKLLPLA